MSRSAVGNDGIDEGWSDVSKKKKKQNKSKSNPNRTLKQKNPYIEIIDPTTNDSDDSAAGNPSSTTTTHEPFMVLLVGLPGSGKSTFAQSLVASMPEKFCRINQDELKTRKKCEQKLKRVLSLSPSPRLCPIIDRCNFDGKQRSTWYRLTAEAAGQGSSLPTTAITDDSNETTESVSKATTQPPLGIPVDVIVLDLPYEECLRRCQTRKGHETIKSPQQAAGVLRQLRREWSPPHHVKNAAEKSKYRSLTIVRTDKERKDCLLRILKQSC